VGQGGAVAGPCVPLVVTVVVVTVDTAVEQGGAITGPCDLVVTASTDEVGGTTGLAGRLTVTVMSMGCSSSTCSDQGSSLGCVMPCDHGTGYGCRLVLLQVQVDLGSGA